MRRLCLSLLILAVTLFPGVAYGQSATTSTPIPDMSGVLGSVSRSFVRPDGPTPGKTYYVAFNVTMFDTMPLEDPAATDATSDIDFQFGRQVASDLDRLLQGQASLETLRDRSNQRQTSAPRIGDFTYAFTTVGTDGDLSMAFVLAGWQCGETYCVYTMMASGLQADLLDDLIEVASNLHDSSSNGLGSIDEEYRHDGAWGELPGLEQLPTGFVFERELVVVSPGDSTPVAGQRP